MVTLGSVIVMMLMGAAVHVVHAKARGGAMGIRSGKEGVIAYWKQRMQGVPMPPVLQAMMTPLSASRVAALRDQLVQQPNFLPAHAAAFCRAAHLACYLESYLAKSSQLNYGYGNMASTSKAVQAQQHGGFFRQNQTLVVGAKVKVQNDAVKVTKGRAFLPRELAMLFPIVGHSAIQNMATLLGMPRSAIPSLEATVVNCDQSRGLPREVRACFSSIEALADFSSTIMAPSQQPITVLEGMSTLPPHSSPNTFHTILAIKTIQGDPNSKYLACHDQIFPFRLFHCHYIDQTRIFLATFQAEDGRKYNRIATCHYDTSSWSPNHVSFSDIHSTPGASEACHWMRKDSIVFLQEYST